MSRKFNMNTTLLCDIRLLDTPFNSNLMYLKNKKISYHYFGAFPLLTDNVCTVFAER